MTKEEWLKERKSGIGASEIASIMGIGYKTDGDIYLDKVTEEIIEIPDNENMRRGREREADVADMFQYERQSWRVIADDGYVLIRHPDRPYCFATPDRHVVVPVVDGDEVTEEWCVLECKHTRREDAWKWKRGEIPPDYFAQVQWQMYCTCRQTGFFAWIYEDLYTEQEEFHWLRIERNDEFIQMMIEFADDFWLNKVLPRNPPDSTPIPIEANEESLAILESLRKITSERKVVEQVEASLKEHLQAYMGNATVLMSEGKPIVTWKYTKDAEYVDLVQLKADYPEVYEACMRRKKGARKFHVVAEKEE